MMKAEVLKHDLHSKKAVLRFPLFKESGGTRKEKSISDEVLQ